MKKLLSLLMTAALLLTLAACGGASNESVTAAVDCATEAPAAAAPMEEYGWAEAETEEAKPEPEAAAEDGTANYAATLKIIKTGNLTVESENFDATDAFIRQTVSAYEGILQDQTIAGPMGSRWGYYVVRIPSADFDAFFYDVTGSCTVVSQSISSEDVTERYTDLDTQLTTNKKKYERLLALMDEATTLTDLYSIESEITEVEYEIDRITGILNGLDSKIAYSTVYIDVTETSAATAVPEDPTFGAALGAAFRNGTKRFLSGVEDFIVSLAYHWFGTLVFVAVFVTALLLLRRLMKKRAARKTPPTEDVPPAEP